MCSSSCSVSSFSGSILELPEVSVDKFTDLTSSAYFLSHCHADHTEGLYSQRLLDHLMKDGVFVYMSEVSAAIVRLESEQSQLHNYIRPLPLGTTVVPLPGNPLWEAEEEPHSVRVTAVGARHCPGSVMLVFRTLYHSVLYTGDCRLQGAGDYCTRLRDQHGAVLDIDTLYLDTTFYSAEYGDFPSREHSARATHTHMRRWLERDDHYIALHTSARYGYEFVFNEIYKHLHMKVLVTEQAWRLYSEFPSLMVGVTDDPSATRIHVCRNRTETRGHDTCLRGHGPPADRFLFVHYSALKWAGYSPGDDVVQLTQRDNHTRLDVCFATHSSRSEIDKFVEFLRPRKVVGFPRPYHRHLEGSGGGTTSPHEEQQQEEDSEEEWVHGYKPDLEDPWGSGDTGDTGGQGDTRGEDGTEEDAGEESSEEVSAKRRKLSAAGEEGDGGDTVTDEEYNEEEEEGNMLTAEELRNILCPGGDDDILYFES